MASWFVSEVFSEVSAVRNSIKQAVNAVEKNLLDANSQGSSDSNVFLANVLGISAPTSQSTPTPAPSSVATSTTTTDVSNTELPPSASTSPVSSPKLPPSTIPKMIPAVSSQPPQPTSSSPSLTNKSLFSTTQPTNKQIDLLSQKLADKEAQLSALLSEGQKLAQKDHTSTTTIKKLKLRESDLLKDLEKKDSEIHLLEKKIDSLSDKISALNDTLTTKTSEIESQSEKISALQKSITDTKTESKTSEIAVSALESKLSLQSTTIHELQSQIASLSITNSNLIHEFSVSEDKYLSQVESLLSRNSSLELKLRELEGGVWQGVKEKIELEELKREKETWKRDLESCESEVESLRLDKSKLEKDKEEGLERYKDAMEIIVRLEKENKELSEKLDVARVDKERDLEVLELEYANRIQQLESKHEQELKAAVSAQKSVLLKSKPESPVLAVDTRKMSISSISAQSSTSALLPTILPPPTPSARKGTVDLSSTYLSSVQPALVIEKLQSSLKVCEGQVLALHAQLGIVTNMRDELATELSQREDQSEMIKNLKSQIEKLETDLNQLNSRYTTALDLLGEKTERVEELQQDILEMKTIFKNQLQEALGIK